MGLTHGGNVFAIARDHGWDWREISDHSASINPLGPAPGVKPAICAALDRITHYPEPEALQLARALASIWRVEEDQILLGNGATELIAFLARIYADSVPVTLTLPVFSEFHRLFPKARTAGLQRPQTWPPGGFLVLTSPANPTGQSLSLNSLRDRLLQSGDPVLIDESFIEFSKLSSATTLLQEHPHLIILRSLTKFYALPGLRIGALIASAGTVRQWKKHREPWQVNSLAEAGTLAAVSDRAHAVQSVTFVQQERAWLQRQIGSLPGTAPHQSEANFLYVGLTYPAHLLCHHLLTRKILIRNCTDWPGLAGEGVRVAVRSRAENGRLLGAWREFE